MEEKGRYLMVTTKSLKWTTIASEIVINENYRLEASVFNLDVKKAKDDIERCPFAKVKLWGPGGFIQAAHYGGRAKRNYVSKYAPSSIGFLGSSEMLQIKPMPEKFLSVNQPGVAQFKVKQQTVLLSRSGTIGNLTFVNETLSRYLVSEHAIRLECNRVPGYVYAYLRSKTGQDLIKANIYGAVINQIEPEHIGVIDIPFAPIEVQETIHSLVFESYKLRDISNNLLDEAEKILIENLNLPRLNKLRTEYLKNDSKLKAFTVPTDQLNLRFDASYHIPEVSAIIDILLDNAETILPLGHSSLTSEIILPGRFKRNYVEEGQGVVFLGGKQIYELDPSNKKFLSVKKHGSRIEAQLFLKENMVAITCSGTIGKVNLIPKHWTNWTMSQHVMRAVPSNSDIPGYLYIWMNSDFGRILIERYTYGAVVDEIEDHHLAQLPIPILHNKEAMKKINDLSLEANKIRSEAYDLEQEAIRQMNDHVIFAEQEILDNN